MATIKRIFATIQTIMNSAVNWSDVNGASTPEPFVVLFAHPPSMPIGLRPD